MQTIHDTARALKAKTSAGAVLCLDGEFYQRPKWRINRNEISFGTPGFRLMLWDRAEEWATETEARKSLKKIRVLVDA